MSGHSKGLDEPLGGLVEAAGIGGTPLEVAFPEPLLPHSEALLRTLGVIVRIDPNAPRLSTNKPASGRSGKTRVQLDPSVRQRQREAYYARADKAHYAPPAVADQTD